MMTAMLKISLGVIAAASVFSVQSASAAATVSETLRDFGLLGSWASQCDAPADIKNDRKTYSVISVDVVQEANDLGPQYEPNVSSITAAERLAPDRLQYTSTLQNGVTRTLIILMRGNTIRTMSNIRSDGTALVKDGNILSNGNATPALTRCN